MYIRHQPNNSNSDKVQVHRLVILYFLHVSSLIIIQWRSFDYKFLRTLMQTNSPSAGLKFLYDLHMKVEAIERDER